MDQIQDYVGYRISDTGMPDSIISVLAKTPDEAREKIAASLSRQGRRELLVWWAKSNCPVVTREKLSEMLSEWIEKCKANRAARE